MEQLRRVLERIRAQLGQLTVSQKLLIGSLSVLMLMMLFIVSQYAGSPSMVELLPQLGPEQQARAVSYLDEKGIEYSVREGGRVFVRTEDRRPVIARMGVDRALPDDTTLLFNNLVEKQDMFMSSTQLEQMHAIARNNELSYLIGLMPGIERASVQISTPQRTGIGYAAVTPTAQVTVFPASNRELDQHLVDALAEMVAGSTAGLEAARVKVIDGARGRVFRARDGEHLAGGNYLEQVAKVERHMEDKLFDALSYIDGVVISVNAIVEGSHTVTDETRYLEKGEGTVAIAEMVTSTTTDQQNAGEGAAPGVGANVALDIDRAGAGTGSSVSESADETQFRVGLGTTQERKISPSGVPQRIYATVAVPMEYVEASLIAMRATQDGQDPARPTPDEISAHFQQVESTRLRQDIEPLVRTAMRSGGEAIADQAETLVRVSMIPVASPLAGRNGPDSAGGLGDAVGGFATLASGGLLKKVLLGGLAVVAMGMMLLLVRKAGRSEPLPSAQELVGVPPVLEGDSDLIGEVDETTTAMEGIEIDDEELEAKKMLEEVAALVAQKPDEAASLLNRWVSPEN